MCDYYCVYIYIYIYTVLLFVSMLIFVLSFKKILLCVPEVMNCVRLVILLLFEMTL